MSSEKLSGELLINISGEDNYYEFSFDLEKNVFNKTKESKSVVIVESGASQIVDKSVDFIEREKRFKIEPIKLETLSNVFSRDELTSISELSTRTTIGNCRPNTSVPIRPLNDKATIDRVPRQVERKLVLIDNKFKYAVVTKADLQKGSGAIINLKDKEIIIPFCGNIVRNVAWSQDGRYIAYAIGDVHEFYANTLIIYDVDKRNIIFQETLNEFISSFAWSPTSNHVAILTKKTRFFSINPLDILGCLSGHPPEYSKFSLKIFDLRQEIKTMRSFISGVKNANSIILWEGNRSN